ncbi:hypothetical protein JCM4814A_80400 [Streptomyces phaeofaciens JCM 4814]|uniref:Uncharacterized protein n=1 Tax=Streptomyces phaeofaciens TaxID=68254 RepID=A0A918HPU3_9ACTN|nr:hypothetical protein GCM10010226_81780 [Streptomyces phaeofaciens]
MTVAAQHADGRLRYFAVPVAADASGASFTVTGAPGAVAGPARIAVGKPPYGVSVPSDGDLSLALGEFLGAYLTGPVRWTATRSRRGAVGGLARTGPRLLQWAVGLIRVCCYRSSTEYEAPGNSQPSVPSPMSATITPSTK